MNDFDERKKMDYVKILTDSIKYTYPALNQKFANDDKQFKLPIVELGIVYSAEQKSNTD